MDVGVGPGEPGAGRRDQRRDAEEADFVAGGGEEDQRLGTLGAGQLGVVPRQPEHDRDAATALRGRGDEARRRRADEDPTRRIGAGEDSPDVEVGGGAEPGPQGEVGALAGFRVGEDRRPRVLPDEQDREVTGAVAGVDVFLARQVADADRGVDEALRAGGDRRFDRRVDFAARRLGDDDDLPGRGRRIEGAVRGGEQRRVDAGRAGRPRVEERRERFGIDPVRVGGERDVRRFEAGEVVAERADLEAVGRELPRDHVQLRPAGLGAAVVVRRAAVLVDRRHQRAGRERVRFRLMPRRRGVVPRRRRVVPGMVGVMAVTMCERRRGEGEDEREEDQKLLGE